MTFPATNFNEAVGLVTIDSNKLHEVINGSADETVTVDNGNELPTVRKALADNIRFTDPIPWVQGVSITNPLELRTFTDGNYYYAAGAATATPIPMGVTPVGDMNWRLAPVQGSVNYIADAQEQLLGTGSVVYPQNVTSVAANGNTVPSGTSHLRVSIGGNPEIVSISPVSVGGAITLLTENGCSIGSQLTTFERVVSNNLVDVRKYGGFGVGDDTDAINHALQEGGRILLSARHRISRPLQFTENSILTTQNGYLDVGIVVGDDFEGEYVCNLTHPDESSALAECGILDILFEWDGTNPADCPAAIRYNYLIRNCPFKNIEYLNWTGRVMYSDGTFTDRSEHLVIENNNLRTIPAGFVRTEVPFDLKFTNETNYNANRVFGGHFASTDDYPETPLLRFTDCQSINVDRQNFFAYSKGVVIDVVTSRVNAQTQSINIDANSFERMAHDSQGRLDLVVVNGGSTISTRATDVRYSRNRYNTIPFQTSGERPAIVLNGCIAPDVDDRFLDVDLGTGTSNALVRTYGVIDQSVTSVSSTNTHIEYKQRGFTFSDNGEEAIEIIASRLLPQINYRIGSNEVSARASTAGGNIRYSLRFDDSGNQFEPFEISGMGYTVAEWNIAGTPSGTPQDSNVLLKTVLWNSVDKRLMIKDIDGSYLVSPVFTAP